MKNATSQHLQNLAAWCAEGSTARMRQDRWNFIIYVLVDGERATIERSCLCVENITKGQPVCTGLVLAVSPSTTDSTNRTC